ncbi:DNA/RNA helicase SEN1 NDAI_0J02480 [Naumovozyma dairenensis CBS 421]|uniref:UvrD-like helicase ATP-binding domain-containing protein n=1 Tax=Naumovozyma dairenensis (strain ATCC 10597 / BCRC 20456 / CBS 421 / NBRC 0211 / NRRL Y-12639) TaxID=1071378 RepID=G0WH62_NAUDC|nr:hypothetical protein NDAI_0J02480 [Naumovozyma dairenensis CBS 421]CCD27140.1 hypothetical protein NDAI_0J02480 [Naumovozyma dairenensis CBS 421]
MNSNTSVNNIYKRAKGYLPTIEQVYAGTNHDVPEANLLGELLQLLAELPPNFHLFCDPILEPISIFCLTIFSFNEQDTVTWLKNKFNPILCQCDKCILSFARGKCKMLQHFAVQRQVPHEHVSKFNDIVCQWRIEALFPTLRKISNGTNTGISITRDIELAIFECLANPHVLRLNPNFKATFDVIFKFFYLSKHYLLDSNNPNCIKDFLAGTIYCWCEGTKEQMSWSKTFLIQKHTKKSTYDVKTLTSDVLEEINIHLLFLQNPVNWNELVIAQFWSRLIPIFTLLEKDVFVEYFEVPKNIESLKKSFKFPIESIFRLWYSHLSKSYNDKPLDFLLRALNMFLEKFGTEFWSKIEPYTFHSILDIVFDRDTFALKLIRIQNNEISENDTSSLFDLSGSVTDLLSWTLQFYHALSPSKRIQMVKKVSMAFLRIIAKYDNLKAVPKACLMNSSTALLRAVLFIKEEERAMLYVQENFETILYTKTDSRALLNNPLIQDIIIRSATNPNVFYPGLGESAMSVSTSTMMVLAECINFDILLLCERTFKLYSGKETGNLPLTLTLLEHLTNQVDLRSFHDGPLLAKQLLIALKNINGLLLVPLKTPVAEKHNETVKMFLNLSTNLIEKFTDILPNQLSAILSDQDAVQGFWACIFSSNTQLYQATTNILYETFDVQGRLEGIQSILTKNLTYHVRAINVVLNQLIKCEFYEPCPRAIRVLMDILSAFTDPINGTFTNYQSLKSNDTDSEVTKFWSLSWSFLDTIYRCTLKWASKYEYSVLENFTKDTLELSKSFVDSYREFSDALRHTNVDLFQNVMKTFVNMLYWLRLSDEALLESCVRLIMSASSIAHERNIKVDDNLVEMIAKYGSKSKKFSNKLSDQQSLEILNMAKSFNKDVTNRIIEEADRYHKEKKNAHIQRIDLTESESPSSSPSLPTKSPIESKVDFLQRKALASSITGKPKQSKITNFGTFQQPSSVKLHNTKPIKPLSNMELARRQLLKNRVVHPPSTSVFHTKSSYEPKKHDDSSSDESGDDIESARELFAIAKGKRTEIQSVDMKGKLIKKESKAEIARREEESMRRRLNIDLGPLYDTVLQWDYTRRNEYPDDAGIETYADVKDQFENTTDYQKIMRPLLLLESWQGLCSARDREENRGFTILIGNRTAVSDFYEVYASISKNAFQEVGVSETDLIVLAYLPDMRPNSRLTNDDFKNAENTCLAKVKSIKYVKGGNVDLSLRIHRNHKFAKFLTIRSEIQAVKVMQMTTVEREYQTLEGLEYYDLVNQILLAVPTPSVTVSPEEIKDVKEKYNLNTSQAEAIVHTVSNEGFSLIQGPPGTGKTKTILGIVGYFLSTRKILSSNIIKTPTDGSKLSIDQLLKKQKVLICAPSNAAVDEICIRLKEGVYDKNGRLFKPNLVRIGRSDVVNVAIKNLTLEELVDRKVAEKNYEFTMDPDLERNFSSSVSKRRELRAQLNNAETATTSTLSTEEIAKLQLEIRELSKVINDLGKKKDELRERNSVNHRNRDLDRRNAQAQILANSEVICSTLSGAAHDVLATLGIKFDTVIVDEACQCTELSSIIPLRYGGKRCIMVGDPNQLPPTVLSGAASNFKYNQSLFVRMEKNSSPYLLNVQYRMHPDISKFPSEEFYQGKLKDGPSMDIINRRPWHQMVPFAPYKFFDISTGKQQQNSKTMSYVNLEEIQVAIELVDKLFNEFDAKIDFTGKIGVISPYREQMQRMRREFTRYFGGSISKSIDFNTIDGFQGQEKEIILISCVRADDTKTSVGFLKDFRRMNVAFTRAKTSMWILGHQQSLLKNKLWKHLINDARSRDCLVVAKPGFLNGKTLSNSRLAELKEIPQMDGYDPHKSEISSVKIPLKRKDLDEEPLSKNVKKAKKEKRDKTVSEDKQKKQNKTEREDRKQKKDKKDRKDKIDISKKKNDSLSVLSAGTKKKSSIFGGPSLSTDVPSTKGSVSIDEKSKKKRRKKKNCHVSFSDDITFIPEKIGNNSTVPLTKHVSLDSTQPHLPKRSPPPSPARTDDANDDYIPSEVEKVVVTDAKPTETERPKIKKQIELSKYNSKNAHSSTTEVPKERPTAPSAQLPSRYESQYQSDPLAKSSNTYSPPTSGQGPTYPQPTYNQQEELFDPYQPLQGQHGLSGPSNCGLPQGSAQHIPQGSNPPYIGAASTNTYPAPIPPPPQAFPPTRYVSDQPLRFGAESGSNGGEPAQSNGPRSNRRQARASPFIPKKRKPHRP